MTAEVITELEFVGGWLVGSLFWLIFFIAMFKD